ncbi:MAG: PAS domain-containing protein [Chloroflexi bacterium]|nr:PAS domain-containing protein [Chloroflexota bacterium]
MPSDTDSIFQEAAWRDLVTHDGVFAVDGQQRIVYWSPSAQRIMGYRPEEVTGKLCYELVQGRDPANYGFCRRNCPVMMNARRGRPTPDYDILCVLPTGEERWLNVTVAIPRSKRGTFRVVHLFRDVTRRRTIEEFSRKAGALLRQLLNEEKAGSPDTLELDSTPLPRLSRRESEVLRLLATGAGTRRIADTLGLRPVTARNHVSRLLTKLGVENRLQAVVYASEHGLI